MADTNGTYRVQYAALPYRVRQDGEVQLRLVTSRETRRWVIPKGWPMKGIPPHKAAAREAYEEAGLLGSIASTPIGIYRYDKRLSATRSVLCEVMVFPMKVKRYLKKWPERSQRVGFWFSIESAASVVQEPELASLILEFGTLMAERHAEKLAETEKAKAKAKTDQEVARKKAAPKTAAKRATKLAAERAPAPPLPDEPAPSQPDDAANGAKPKPKPKSKPKTKAKAKSDPLSKAKGEALVAEHAAGIEVEHATVAAGALAVSEVVAEAKPNLKSQSKAQPEPESISKPNPKPEPKSKLKPKPKLKSKTGSEAVAASVLEGEASSTAVLLADQGLLAQVAVAEEPPLADDLATQAVAPKPGAKKSVVKKSASKKASVKKVPAKKAVAEKAPDKLAEGGTKGGAKRGAEGRSELDRATTEVPVDAMEPEAVLPTQSTAPERARKKATAK